MAIQPFIQDEMRKRQVFFSVSPVKHKGVNKEVRIRGLIPRWESKSIFFVAENLELLDDVQKRSGAKIILALKGFAMWSTFDLVSKYLKGCTASGLYEARLAREEFTKFDNSKMGAKTNLESAKNGFYFTNNKDVAQGYRAEGAYKTDVLKKFLKPARYLSTLLFLFL
jgi:hypothetical protein